MKWSALCDDPRQLELRGYNFDTVDPHTRNGVLRNSWGISNTDDLNDAERAVTKVILTAASFPQKTQGQFDLVHLRLIHRVIFCDIYPWAGELRQVDVLKGDTLFEPCVHIEQLANHVFDQLKIDDFLRHRSASDFADAAGLLMSSINMIHPFREGNGRTQRVFLQRLAWNAGYMLDWQSVSDESMRRAAIAAENDQPRLLQRLISLNIKPRDNNPVHGFIGL